MLLMYEVNALILIIVDEFQELELEKRMEGADRYIIYLEENIFNYIGGNVIKDTLYFHSLFLKKIYIKLLKLSNFFLQENVQTILAHIYTLLFTRLHIFLF